MQYNGVTIAFILGIILGFLLAYFMGDMVKAVIKWWRHIVFKPRYLSINKPRQPPQK